MNLSKGILRREEYLQDLGKDVYNSLGFKSHSREISLFLKESKNLNGIKGHNLVTKINGIITNYSIVDDTTHMCRILNKTVYVCEIEFPKRITLDMLKRDVNAFISIATINPINAFMNCYVLYHEEFVDLGLTMVDLTSPEKYKHSVLNLSKADLNNPLFRDIVYKNGYNPKYYNHYDYNRIGGDNDSYSGLIAEFYDSKTKIVCNTHGDESVDNFINNDSQTGIYINKRTISISNSISDIFSRIMFVCIENLEFVYRSSMNDLNIKKLSLFSSFREDLRNFICDEVKKLIDEWVLEFNKLIDYHDYYLVFSIDHQFAVFDIFFLKENKEIRITKPIYKLYAESRFDNEVASNHIKLEATMKDPNPIKLGYIKESILSLGEAAKAVSNIKDAIQIANMAQQTVQMFIDETKNINNNLLPDNNVRCLENDKYQRSQKL